MNSAASNVKAKRPRWRRVALFLLPVCLVLFALMPYGLIRREPLARADAIVIFSGSNVYAERAEWAAQLWQESRAARLIVTYDYQHAGWDERRQRNPTFTERSIDILHSRGVPDERITVVYQAAYNTHGEAVKVREYAEKHGLRSLIFVTSPYHTRRAWWTLRQVFDGSGIVLGLDAPPPGRESPEPWRWWLKSDGWKLVLGEYLKFIYYRLRY
jgi:uncharacterized SAM-binding protein YcdF (DUF218 family)